VLEAKVLLVEARALREPCFKTAGGFGDVHG
jgi:hypothetical protein